MLLNLIKKDLITCRNSIAINMLVLLVISSAMFKIGLLDIFLMVNIIYIVLLAITPLTMEDKLRADKLTLSLPADRKKIVGSRYLFALLAIIVMIIFVFAYGYILSIFITANNFDFASALTFSSVFSIFFFTVMAVAFFIPFVYRFGQNGIMLGLGGTVLLSTIFFMITAIGLRSQMIKTVIGGFFERMGKGGLSNFFNYVSRDMGTALALIMLTAIMTAVVFTSVRMSMFIYARKEF